MLFRNISEYFGISIVVTGAPCNHYLHDTNSECSWDEKENFFSRSYSQIEIEVLTFSKVENKGDAFSLEKTRSDNTFDASFLPKSLFCPPLYLRNYQNS